MVVKILTQDQDSEKEVKHQTAHTHAEKRMPPYPDRQKSHIENEPSAEKTKEQFRVPHKISSIYSVPGIGLLQ
jgi:hypothetical protein